MIRFTDEEAGKRADTLVKMIENAVRDRATRLEKLATIRKLYYGITDRVPRYVGQPNLHLPVLTEKIENIAPKEMNAFWGAEPHVHARKVGGKGNPEDARLTEEFQNWACETDIPNLYETMDIWFKNRHIDGTSVVKTYYRLAMRWTTVVTSAKHSWRAGETDYTGAEVPVDRKKTPFEIMAGVLGPTLVVRAIERNELDEESGLPTGTTYWEYDDGASSVEEAEAYEGLAFQVEFVEARRQYSNVRVTFSESPFVDEINLRIYRPIIVKDNVEVDNIDIENIVVPYRAKNLQEAPFVAHLYWLTYDEIERRRISEGWNLSKDDMEQVHASVTTTDEHEVLEDNRSLRDVVDRVTGHQPGTGQPRESLMKPYSSNKALMLEVYLQDDLNGDGEPEELIYQIPYGLGKIVHACHLDEVFPHGRRPFPELHSIPINGQFLSMSLAEYIAPINIEVDAIVNMVHETQELINTPWFFFVPAAFTVDPEVLLNLKPGAGIPVADINSVMLPKFPQEPLANLAAVDSLLLFADRLTVSPQATGSSQVRNAPRTARGTLALLSEGGIKIDSYIMAAQKGGWRELMHQIHGLYNSFGPDEKIFWVTGDPNPRRISRQAMAGRYEFTFSGNTVNTNRELKRTIAQTRYQLLITNPLYAMDPQALRALTLDLLRNMSEGINPEDLLPRIPGQGGTHPPYDQNTENQMMMQLVPVDPLSTDDHAEHMAKVQTLIQSPVFAQLPTEAVALIGNHFAMHSNMLVAQQPQRVPIAGQANNVPTQPTPGASGELSALEGGVA